MLAFDFPIVPWKYITVYALLYLSFDICHYIIHFTLYYVVNILAHGIYDTHLPLVNNDKRVDDIYDSIRPISNSPNQSELCISFFIITLSTILSENYLILLKQN